MSKLNQHSTQAQFETFIATGQRPGLFATQALIKSWLDLARSEILSLRGRSSPRAAASAALNARPPAPPATTTTTRPATLAAPAAATGEPKTAAEFWQTYKRLNQSDPKSATLFFREHGQKFGVRSVRA